MTTGALTSIHFGWERYWTGTAWTGTYGSASGTIDKVFGEGQKISALEKGNNLEVIYSLGNRGGVKNVEKKFTGSFGIECNLANPYIFRALLGNGGTIGAVTAVTTTVGTASVQGDRTLTLTSAIGFVVNDWVKIYSGVPDTEYIQIESISGSELRFHSPTMFDHAALDDVEVWDAGAGPDYIHVFTEMNEAPSLTILNSFDLDTDAQISMLGCVNTSTTISAAIDEVVSLKMDFECANDTLAALPFTQQTQEIEEMYTFAHASVKKYTGGAWSAISANEVIQSFEISVNPNTEIIYGLGSRTGKQRAGKQFEYDLSLSLMFEDPAEMLAFFYDGSATGTTPSCIDPMMLQFEVDYCGTHAYTIQFANVKIDTDSIPQDPTAVVMEDVALKATNMTVWGYNTTSAIP